MSYMRGRVMSGETTSIRDAREPARIDMLARNHDGHCGSWRHVSIWPYSEPVLR